MREREGTTVTRTVRTQWITWNLKISTIYHNIWLKSRNDVFINVNLSKHFQNGESLSTERRRKKNQQKSGVKFCVQETVLLMIISHFVNMCLGMVSGVFGQTARKCVTNFHRWVSGYRKCVTPKFWPIYGFKRLKPSISKHWFKRAEQHLAANIFSRESLMLKTWCLLGKGSNFSYFSNRRLRT